MDREVFWAAWHRCFLIAERIGVYGESELLSLIRAHPDGSTAKVSLFLDLTVLTMFL